MLFVNQIRNPTTPSVSPDATVQDLAELLLETGLEGVCVVEGDALVGVVTAMDIVFQEKRPDTGAMHLWPRLVKLLAASRFEEQMARTRGVLVRDIMTRDPVTVPFDASVEDLATLMVDGHFTVMPIMNGEHFVGAVTKRDVVQAVVERYKAFGAPVSA